MGNLLEDCTHLLPIVNYSKKQKHCQYTHSDPSILHQQASHCTKTTHHKLTTGKQRGHRFAHRLCVQWVDFTATKRPTTHDKSTYYINFLDKGDQKRPGVTSGVKLKYWSNDGKETKRTSKAGEKIMFIILNKLNPSALKNFKRTINSSTILLYLINYPPSLQSLKANLVENLKYNNRTMILTSVIRLAGK